MRPLVVAASLSLLAGCPIDRFTHYDRPAHAEIGFNTRHFAARPEATAARETTAPDSDMDVDGTAASLSFRFTMKARWSTYLGGEAEAGAFAHESGSNLAGGYAVLGKRLPFRLGSISAELAGGWRSMRDSLDAPDYSLYVVEPRVRGEMWLSPMLTLGAAAGAEVGGQRAWMAGLYVGVHSHAYGVDTPAR